MRLTPAFLLLIVAIVLFLVAALGVRVGDISLIALGLAAFAAAFLFERVTLR